MAATVEQVELLVPEAQAKAIVHGLDDGREDRVMPVGGGTPQQPYAG